MPLPDIKGVGVLSDVVRFGTPHHGILDGVLLADGGAGVSHPALVSYQQRNGLWITPTLKHVVPGFTPPTLPPPAVGAEWLDYGIMSGMARALYKKSIFSGALDHHYWLTSFATGDTWRCAITSSTVSVSAGGGSAQVSVKLTRFGKMEAPPVTEEFFNLTSNALSSVGQPSFSGGATDFPSSALKLVALDVSLDGRKAILAVMPVVADYAGYSAPRGLLLLEVSKTAATLTLLKSRSDMLVSVTRVITSSSQSGGSSEADYSCTVPGTVVIPAFNYSRVITHTAVSLVGAYFDAAGAVEFARATISKVNHDTSTFSSWTTNCISCVGGQMQGCTIPAQTVTSTVKYKITETATLDKVIAGGVIAVGTSVHETTGTGSHSVSGGSFVNDVSVVGTITQNSISGRAYTGGSSSTLTQTVTGTPENGTPFTDFHHYPEYTNSIIGSLIRPPFEFTDTTGQYPVAMVGFGGMLAHFSNASIEVSFFPARLGGGGFVSAASSAIVSVHPHTGQLAKKTGTWTGAPSFGWV